MTPATIRYFWSLIESTQTHVLLKLDDPSLVQWLLKQVDQGRSLNNEESNMLSDYIYSRLTLIRDLAHERLTPDPLF